MEIIFSKTFTKAYVKLDEKIKLHFSKRLEIFIENEFDPILRNHLLQGKYKNIRSINITGDFRAHYTKQGENAYFSAIGTHSELYEK